jgi:hypothetical protein
MIKFFRKVRSQLLGEGKFSKYMIYAFGEIILVVVGILLAIQFNSWSVERGENTKAQWYLNNILDDLHYQTQSLDMIEAEYNAAIHASKTILRTYYAKGSFTEVDSLNYHLNTLMYAQFFPNTNSSYRELVSSGQLSLIKDKDLSLEVIDFYLFSEDNEQIFKNDIDNIFYPQIYPVLSSLVQVDLGDYVSDEKDAYLLDQLPSISKLILQKLQDPEIQLSLENAIKLKILILTDQLAIIKETQKGAKELNALIEASLQQPSNE